MRGLKRDKHIAAKKQAAKKQAGKKQAGKKQAAKKQAGKQQVRRSRTELIEELGRATPEGLGAGSTLPKGLHWAAPDPFASFSRPQMDYLGVLAGLHERLRPRTYFEIGVSLGESLTLSRTRTIAVDPAYRIAKPLRCDLAAYVETSDAFFARPDAFEHFGDAQIDLAFIDGMHLAEYALRDFINTEKRMSPGGVVVLDDMLPRNSLEAARIRRTKAWAGDVFKVHQVLREHRPDLTLIPLNATPTGSYLVLGLDPASTVLDEAYESLVPFLSSSDPQSVDDAWCERQEACEPAAVLDAPEWEQVVELRDGDAGRDRFAELWPRIVGAHAVPQ